MSHSDESGALTSLRSRERSDAAQSGRGRAFAFSVVFATALIDSIGFGIILPVTPDLLMSVSGASLASSAVYGGWLMMVFAVMQFFAMPVIGNLSDAFGRKPVLSISLGVLAANYLLMGLAESLTLLFIGRLLSGVGSATFSTCMPTSLIALPLRSERNISG